MTRKNTWVRFAVAVVLSLPLTACKDTKTLQENEQLKAHVAGALANGCSIDEIRETLLHTAVYAGVPAGVEAFNAAAEVLARHGKNSQ